jgi:hypothetical protein
MVSERATFTGIKTAAASKDQSQIVAARWRGP